MKHSSSLRAAVAALLTALLMALAACSSDADQPIATLGGETITREELEFYADQERADVRNYFTAHHDVSLKTDEMWYDSYDGECPMQMLYDRALEICREDHALFRLGRENGLDAPEGYRDLLEWTERENESRKQAADAGEVVYGKLELTAEESLGRLRTNVKNDLITLLSEGDGSPLAATEEETRRYFEDHEDDWRVAVETVHATELILAAPLTADDATAIEAMWRSGEEVNDIQARYPAGLTVKIREFTGDTLENDMRACYEIRTAADEMEEGEVRTVQTGEVASVLRLDSRQVDTQAAYAHYQQQIRQTLAEQKWDGYFDEFQNSLETSLDQAAFDGLWQK